MLKTKEEEAAAHPGWRVPREQAGRQFHGRHSRGRCGWGGSRGACLFALNSDSRGSAQGDVNARAKLQRWIQPVL